jgi:hypothetical protein
VYVVKLNGLMVVQSDQLRECMQWLTRKAAEYDSERVNWLPGPGQDILTLVAGTQQWTLSDTREYYRWSVTIPVTPSADDRVAADKVVGVFSYLDDAKRAVEMTWGKVSFTPDSDEFSNPVDVYQFACAQVSGTLQRVKCYKAPAKLSAE